MKQNCCSFKSFLFDIMNDVLLITSNRWDVMDKGINASNASNKNKFYQNAFDKN